MFCPRLRSWRDAIAGAGRYWMIGLALRGESDRFADGDASLVAESVADQDAKHRVLRVSGHNVVDFSY